jgi:hypothetical protein
MDVVLDHLRGRRLFAPTSSSDSDCGYEYYPYDGPLGCAQKDFFSGPTTIGWLLIFRIVISCQMCIVSLLHLFLQQPHLRLGFATDQKRPTSMLLPASKETHQMVDQVDRSRRSIAFPFIAIGQAILFRTH